jgi:hypothetical protein
VIAGPFSQGSGRLIEAQGGSAYIGCTFGDRSTTHLSGCRLAAMQLCASTFLRPSGLLADNPSFEGLWFAGRVIEGGAYGIKSAHRP